MKTIKKRFIAGAVCPSCKAMDKIVTYSLEGKDYRECVECDFIDELRFKAGSAELETRVNTSDEETEPVRLIQPKR